MRTIMSGAEAACVWRPKVLLTYLALFRSHLILTQVCWGLHLLELQNSVQGYVLAAFFDGLGKVLRWRDGDQLPSCCILLTDFRTIFVFALGPSLPMWVLFSPLMGILMYPHAHDMGRKGPRAKTKIVVKSMSKMQQLGSMPILNFKTFLNKNHPTKVCILLKYDKIDIVA